jgi:hypothetical protein
VTAQALVALEEKPFPLRPASRHKATTAALRVKPASATTTSIADQAPAQKQPKDKPSRWPLLFMAVLGVAAIAGLRLAWRRE